MARNEGRVGAVKARSQVKNPITGTWTKRDDKTGKFMDVKADPKPFKGVRKTLKFGEDQRTPMLARKTRDAKPRMLTDGASTGPMREYILRCDVKLNGAEMYVRARSPEEALAKGQSNQWDDIKYAHAELVGWNITSGAKENR